MMAKKNQFLKMLKTKIEIKDSLQMAIAFKKIVKFKIKESKNMILMNKIS